MSTCMQNKGVPITEDKVILNVFTYEEALSSSTLYFDGDELAAKVFVDKYALRDNNNNLIEKTPDDMHRRMAKEFARIEASKFKKPLTEDEIYQSFKGFKRIVPQGSPMYGIGNTHQFISLSNCFVIDSPLDAYGSIMEADEHLVQISKRRGGVGTDLSNLRPNGAPTKNAARTSTGVVAFAERYSNSIREVGQCIEENQRVLTSNGIKKIKEIKIEDMVWTKKGWTKVNNVINNGEKQLFKTTTKSGFSVITSKDHVFQTFNENGDLTETQLKDINIGDSVVLCSSNGSHHTNYIRLNSTSYKNINNKPISCKIPDMLDEKLAYILGYSYGDGYVAKTEHGNIGLSLACSNDYPKIKEKLKKYCLDIFDYNVSVKKSSPGSGDCEQLQIYNKTIVTWLEENGLLKEKSYGIKMPQSILNSTISVQGAFISGYFDADGYASGRKKGYVFSSISLSFLKEIQIILSTIGVMSKIHTEYRTEKGCKTLYSLAIVGKESQKAFIPFAEESIKTSDLAFISKRECWLTPYKAKSFDIKYNDYPFCPDNTQYLSRGAATKLKETNFNVVSYLSQDKVVSIKEIGTGVTYDLALESEHLFWCEGFYLHNSGRRGALMLTLSVHHPDILEFTNVKRNMSKITGANISIRLSDEFLKAVEKNEDYEQRWPVDSSSPKISRKVNAKEVWDNIVDNAHHMAEPGLLFWDNIIKESPADCYADVGFKTISTNPCVTADTWVFTSSGPRLVKELIGEQFDATVNGSLYSSDYRGFYKTGTKDVYEIETSSGYSVKCTADHPIKVVTFSNRQKKLEWKKAGEINVGEMIALSNHRDFEWEGNGTSDEGWLLGSMVGDGFIHGKQACLQFWGDDKKEMMFLAREKIRTSVAARSDCGNGSNLSRLAVKLDSLKLGSVGLKELSEKFNIHSDKILKTEIEKTSKDFHKGFLRGWFDADGHVGINTKNKTNYIRLSSVILENLQVAQRMLSRLGIISAIYKRRDEGLKSLPDGKGGSKEYYCKTMYEINISKDNINIFANEIGFDSVSKKRKLDEIIKNFTKGPYKEKFCTKVIGFRKIEQVEVYDCTVPGISEFDANGICVHNCAELLLSAFDSCRLMLINTFEYVKNPFTKQAEFDMEKFNKDVVLCQRLMDDMVDLEIESVDRIISKIKSDPEPMDVRSRELSMWKKIRKVCEQGRRTGTGVTAIGDTIAALGLPYCSNKGIDLVESIYRNLKLSSYRSSVDMAKELGAFPVWNAEKEVNNSFLNRIKDEDKNLYNDMQKYGRRNIALLTTAPAGSVSLLTQTSSGIEPQFMIEPYIRRKKGNPGDTGFRIDFVDQSGDSWMEFRVYPPKVKMWMEISKEKDLTKSPWSGSTAAELNWKKRVELQAKATKHVDHSISSTLNLPNDVSVEAVNEIYKTAWHSGCKGVTIYRDGCRTGVLVADTKKECKDEIIITRAPKRPETLSCDVHHCTAKGKSYFVIIGKLKDKPYEIFASLNHTSDSDEDLLISKSFTSGTLTKENRGHYKAELFDKNGNTMIIKKIGDKLTEEESALTRMISTALRHGADVQFVVHQLEKVEGAMYGFSKSISRALKKYVADGTEVSGETCGSCQTKDKCALVRQEGCIICKSCGWSKCG